MASNGIKIGKDSSIFGSSRGIKSSISKGSVVSTLMETNRILVEVQKQLALDFSSRISRQQADNQSEKERLSRQRFGKEEREAEKKRKKIAKVIKEKSRAIVEPIKDVFDRIKKFLLTLGAGFLTNNIFKWLSDPENRKKVSNWYNFVSENWKWILSAVALFNSAKIATTVLGSVSNIMKAIGLIKTILALLFSPLVLKILAVIALGAGAYLGIKKIIELIQGGPFKQGATKRNEEILKEKGVTLNFLQGNKPEVYVENPKQRKKGGIGQDWVDKLFPVGPGYYPLEEYGTEEQKRAYKNYLEIKKAIEKLSKKYEEDLKLVGDDPFKRQLLEMDYAEALLNIIPKQLKENNKPLFTEFGDYPYYGDVFKPNEDTSNQVSSLMDFAEGADSIQIVNLPPKETTTENNSVANISKMKSVNINPIDVTNPWMTITPEVLGISMIPT